MTARRSVTVADALRQAQGKLSASSSTARLDADCLLADLLGVARSHLFTHPERLLTPEQIDAFRERIERRAEGVPVAHLTGHCEFFGLRLRVDSGCLVPRPETEHLVELAVALLPRAGSLIDLGTGSGAIALAIASERPDAVITATDSSPEALATAAANRDALGLTHVTLEQGDWFSGVADGQWDVIVSNPPYVETTSPEWRSGALQHEPALALAAGPDGLDAIRALLSPAVTRLRTGGSLVLEHGARQGEAVRGLLTAAGLSGVTTHRDLAGLERITVGFTDG